MLTIRFFKSKSLGIRFGLSVTLKYIFYNWTCGRFFSVCYFWPFNNSRRSGKRLWTCFSKSKSLGTLFGSSVTLKYIEKDA